jgi:glycosyltransferase involved in cell wall biosynthesis
MRILHLGFEDYAQPGSGGGSIRTCEVNRRLAARHEITVVTAGYPGARPRVEDGVRWEPLWPRRGAMLNRLAYFALLGPAIARHPHDLLVEDLSAPFSTGFAPLYTRRPVVASVQWLFAEQMTAKYRLPFHLVERMGLPLYRHFIAVSGWLAETIRGREPRADVRTIHNGVEPLAFEVEPQRPAHLLFVGRLDTEQKGCDLLLQAVARARTLVGNLPPVLLAGDGPDRPQLEKQAAALGLSEIVRFLGRVEGAEKYRLMAGAHALLMPSRFETFGMVAAEAQAAGAPVVTFDVGPLVEVAGGGGARLIPPFDIDAFARAVAELVSDADQREQIARQGRRWARRYDWDVIAREQEAAYLEVAEQGRVRSQQRADARGLR